MNNIQIFILVWTILSVPFIIHNLMYWIKGNVKENPYLDQINVLKATRKTYYFIVMLLILSVVTLTTYILFPLYLIDIIRKRGLTNE